MQKESAMAASHLVTHPSASPPQELYLIRHGESEYNAACAASGSAWADPLIFDAPLTKLGRRQVRAYVVATGGLPAPAAVLQPPAPQASPRGCRRAPPQARGLRRRLHEMALPPDTLWVTSPLTRAIETLLLACPSGSKLAECSDNGEPNLGGEVPHNLAVRRCVPFRIGRSPGGSPAVQQRLLAPCPTTLRCTQRDRREAGHRRGRGPAAQRAQRAVPAAGASSGAPARGVVVQPTWEEQLRTGGVAACARAQGVGAGAGKGGGALPPPLPKHASGGAGNHRQRWQDEPVPRFS